MEVCSDLKLSKSTFYLSIYIVDAYFSRQNYFIKLNEIQLIGAAALYISSKKEVFFLSSFFFFFFPCLF